MESQRLMQTMVPNNSAYFHGMCEDLGIEIDTCHGDADAFYDNNGRCKVCTLPINRHSIPQSIIESWETNKSLWFPGMSNFRDTEV